MHHRYFILGAALALLPASGAWAQGPRDAIEGKTRPGDVLTIDVRGQDPIEGKLVSAAADAVIVELGGDTRTVAYSDIDRLRRRRNGVRLGAIAGAGAGLACGTFGAMIGVQTEGATTAEIVRLLAVTTGIGAAVGAALDAALSVNRTIYRRSSTSARVDVAPRPGGAAVGLTIRW